MGDVALIAVLIAAFALAVGLVKVIGLLVDSGGRDGWADEPPVAFGTRTGAGDPGVTGPGGRR